MFCKTTYCALILMIEAALVYGSGEGVEIAFVSRKHTIPTGMFDGIVKKLEAKHLIVIVNNKLYLKTSPDKISIWQIVRNVAEYNVFTGRYLDEDKLALPTSAMTMIHKENELMLKMIEDRLHRQKLSTWSEKASKTIYI